MIACVDIVQRDLRHSGSLLDPCYLALVRLILVILVILSLPWLGLTCPREVRVEDDDGDDEEETAAWSNLG